MLTELREKRIVRSTLKPSKIVAIGLNYSEHITEVQKKLPTEPVFFLKPISAIIPDKGVIVLPSMSKEVHHECELAVIIGSRTRHVQEAAAMQHVYGYSIILDVTARDLQRQAIEQGLPYALSKGFDTFAPLYHIVPKKKISDPHNLELELRVNGEVRQKSNTRNMIFKIDRIISYISQVMTLEKGDIIATGTPSGVGPLKPGDVVTASIDKIGTLTVKVSK